MQHQACRDKSSGHWGQKERLSQRTTRWDNPSRTPWLSRCHIRLPDFHRSLVFWFRKVEPEITDLRDGGIPSLVCTGSRIIIRNQICHDNYQKTETLARTVFFLNKNICHGNHKKHICHDLTKLFNMSSSFSTHWIRLEGKSVMLWNLPGNTSP